MEKVIGCLNFPILGLILAEQTKWNVTGKNLRRLLGAHTKHTPNDSGHLPLPNPDSYQITFSTNTSIKYALKLQLAMLHQMSEN